MVEKLLLPYLLKVAKKFCLDAEARFSQNDNKLAHLIEPALAKYATTTEGMFSTRWRNTPTIDGDDEAVYMMTQAAGTYGNLYRFSIYTESHLLVYTRFLTDRTRNTIGILYPTPV
jgi:hypothetical protein